MPTRSLSFQLNLNPLRTFRSAVIALAALLQFGCTDNPTTIDDGETAAPTIARTIWQGAYTTEDATDNGVLTLDLTRTNDAVQGEMVFRSRASETPHTYIYVKGTQVGDDLTLTLDTDMAPYGWQFTFVAADSGDTLSGDFTASPWSLSANFAAAKLNVKSLISDYDTLEARFPRGLAFHNDHIWVSRDFETYERRDLNGEFVSELNVFLSPGLHWTSGPLTSDGTNLVGHLPIAVMNGDISSNESDIISFDEAGAITSRVRLEHRTAGLTYDGVDLWSLPISSDGLYRFDSSGSILEMLPVNVPDLVDVVFDGTWVWAPSWFLSLLYQIDSSGQVVNVYDLPQPSELSRSRAITFDGSSFWYLVSNLSSGQWLYRFQPSPG